MADTARRFGKYRLLRRIASGGMGEVHLAKLIGPSGFEKLVTIKRLLENRVGERKYIDMFYSEARVAAQLNHSNIVQVYEVGEESGAPYIAMEYVQGKSLRKIMDTAHKRPTTLGKDGLPPGFIVSIMAQLCMGLAYAHDARHLSGAPMGLIHRDINPHNVLVSYQGEVKIIDFGIAKSELTLEQTQAGTIKGTVVYMSPEQSLGHKLDKRSDLFSVGICLYEALTGRNPFHKASMGQSLEAIRQAIVPAIDQSNRDLAPFAPILERALARSASDRYQDCTECAEALQALLASSSIARPPIPLSAYLAELFSRDMADEERLLERTEMAENPLDAGDDAENTRNELVLREATEHSHPPLGREGQEGTARSLGFGIGGTRVTGLPESGVGEVADLMFSESSEAQKEMPALKARAPQSAIDTESTIGQDKSPSPVVKQKSSTTVVDLQMGQGSFDVPPARQHAQRRQQETTPSPLMILVRPLAPIVLRAAHGLMRLCLGPIKLLRKRLPLVDAKISAWESQYHRYVGQPEVQRALPQIKVGAALMGAIVIIGVLSRPILHPRQTPMPTQIEIVDANTNLAPMTLDENIALVAQDKIAEAQAESSVPAKKQDVEVVPAHPIVPAHRTSAAAPAARNLAVDKTKVRLVPHGWHRAPPHVGTEMPMVSVNVDPPVAILQDGIVEPRSFHLRGPTGTLQFGSNPMSDPFLVKIRYKVQRGGVSFSVDSEPWANVLSAGGINLGRTPLRWTEASNLAVFELKNARVPTSQRITLRLTQKAP